ncbi:MAG: prolipoprotein diacylglyceryl transferase [Actinomycetes bacterium]
MRHIPTFMPSPSNGVWHLGPVPIRAYALCILAGIFIAVWLGNRRFIARGGINGQVADVAIWAVPFGIVGGRLYHVATDWQAYVGEGGKGFLGMFRIWEGGLGIWGAIALGGVGAWIGCMRHGVPFAPFADAIAPGVAIAQGVGRFGNWFNQELFGKPTTVPWALEIDTAHRPTGFEQYETFHPTFLYEAIACFVIAAVVIWADKKFKMGHGRVFALYVAIYCAARGLIETLRIDEAHHIGGIRLNVFTALIVGACSLGYLVISAERYPGRELMYKGKLVSEIPEVPLIARQVRVNDEPKAEEPKTDEPKTEVSDPASVKEEPARVLVAQAEVTAVASEPPAVTIASPADAKPRGRRRKT